jgi:chemotaxis protein methyltransferase WspC
MAPVDFESLLKNAMGLDAISIGSAAIQRAVRLRMANLGVKRTDDYGQHLRSSADELQELIETVVVPETWFFRDCEAFATLARLVAEEWRRDPSATVLRLLSVPCSTGEEPYSMAMSLLDGGLSPQQIQVDAVDISARALARASRGVYGPNSFRGANLAFRERYFQPAANDHALVEWLRDLVTFQQSNVLSPDFSARQEPYDVIFCRNLLIYFDRSTQDQVMKTLARLLKPGGLLFVGPAEAFLASCSGFASVNQAMSFAFRKTGKTFFSSVVSLPEPAKPPIKPPIKRQHRPRSQPTTTPQSLSAPASIPSKPPRAGLEAARSLANAGRLQEAGAWCEANLIEQGPSSETYYLSGLVRDAIGDRDGAAAFYRKVIYLEPEHVEGLMHLALMAETEGDTAAAGRFRERARRVEQRAKEKAL